MPQSLAQRCMDHQTCFAGKSKRLGGTLRRIGKVLRQFDLTYDLMAMTSGQIYDLLLREFDRFKG